MSFQPEQLFGKYRILKRIGVGGMATVFHANHIETGQEVALKVLHEQWAFDATVRKRFELEASIGSKLTHPGIVPIYDYGVEHDRPFIVLRYMEGGNLANEFARLRPVSLTVTAKLLTVIGRALDYAHDKNIIHRDLKLENIMLDSKRRPAIGDFGIAKLVGTTRLTITGQFVGTPQYIAPETLGTNSDELDKSVDLYAFAVMAYLMATGYFPFTATDPFQLALKHKRELPPVPTSIKPDLPPRLNAVLLRGLQKNPIARYTTAGEFAGAFTAALEDKGGNTTLIFMDKLNPGKGELVDAPVITTPAFLSVEEKEAMGGVDTTIFEDNPDDTGGVDTALHGDSEADNVITSAIPHASVTAVEPAPKRKRRRGLGVALLLTLLCGVSFGLFQYREPITEALVAFSNSGRKVFVMDDAAVNKFELTPTAASEAIDEATPTVTVLSNQLSDEAVTPATRTPHSTNTVRPSRTATLRPTNTATTRPTNTATTRPTNTATLRPSNTPVPPTNTPRPAPTNIPIPIVPTTIPVVATAIPIVPTTIPIIATTIPIVPTVIQVIPTVVNNIVEPVVGGGNDSDGGILGGVIPTVTCLLGCG